MVSKLVSPPVALSWSCTGSAPGPGTAPAAAAVTPSASTYFDLGETGIRAGGVR